METLRSFHSIIHSHPFTFLIGPNHTKLTIQSGLAKHVSRPLDHLMNSGETRESKHHIAVLEEEDVETFTAFCEYAYTGDYVVPPPGKREDEREQVVENPFKGFLRGERGAVDAARMAAGPGSGVGMGMGMGMTPGMGVESVGSPAVSSAEFQGFQGWNGFLPPPAPSPPPPPAGYGPGPGPGHVNGYGYENGVDGLGLNAKSWEEMRAEVKVPEQAIDDDDDIEPFPAMPAEKAEKAEKAPEKAPEKEDVKPEQPEKSEQPEPAQPEPEEGKSKKSKKNKKDKKKKGNTEEAPELTPPTTPPAKQTENPAESSVGEPGPDIAEDGGGASAEPTLPVETVGQMESKAESNQGEEGKREEKKQDQPEQEEQEEQQAQQAQPQEMQQPPPQPPPQKHEPFPLFTPRDERIDMWDEFMTLAYIDQRPTYPTPRSQVAKACTPDDLPYLTFHAKVYVFATRYLIPALAQLSLQKLHRDLLYLAFPVDPDFSAPPAPALASAGGHSSIPARADEEDDEELQRTKARMVLDLLYYTYSKTTRVEPTIIRSGSRLEREEEEEEEEHQRPSELRKLVVHYAACKVRDLAKYGPVNGHDRKPSRRGLRGLLDTMSELASDLVFRMM